MPSMPLNYANFGRLFHKNMTKGEFVSRVINSFNSISKDGRISRRQILHVGKNFVKDYLSKRLSEKRGLKDLNIVTTLTCVELVQDNYISCGILEFKRCKSLSRTKYKLPEMIEGDSIIEAYSLDGGQRIFPTTLSKYRRDSQRAGTDDNVYYYLKNNYMYIPDQNIKNIEIQLITLDPPTISDCDNIWDTAFIVPEKLIGNVVDATRAEVYDTKRLPKDENPNLNGSN